MTDTSLTAPGTAPFVPVAVHQRIEALDVVRGFALLGIFLMNIEWFSRPFAAFNEGIPRTATGLDWFATFFVNYFVQGKFWTIFSLLFGMGFAVMLVRAEQAGRPFTKVYLRRILALAVFGALHYLFIWEGDILVSYAVGALGLLIVLYGRAWPIVIACAVLIGLGFLPRADSLFGVAGGLALIGLLALYLRGTKLLRLRGLAIPVFSFILLLGGAVMTVVAAVLFALHAGPEEARGNLGVFGPLLFIAGWLSWKYHQPAEKRGLRMAVSIYIFVALAMTAGGVTQRVMPDPTVARVTADKATAKVEETRAEKERADRAKRLKERAEHKADEVKTFSTGSYPSLVDWRARNFPKKVAGDAGFALILVAMFLLGVWFVRSGVMAEPAKHLAFYRKLALYGLPLGLGLGLLTAVVGVSHTPGDRYDGWGITRGILFLGNLPACLGYVGLVVTMLFSNTPFARIRVLAPLGRMALTNYLLQSIICMLYFYGFGLGHWGMPRAQQVLFVALVYGLQIVFSHWWLARFRYGPMEWLWRGFTYRQVPPFRIAGGGASAPAQPA